jgi:hypothetical protein
LTIISANGYPILIKTLCQIPVFIDTVNCVEYTIKKILSSLNLDKYNKNVISAIRDSEWYESDYDEHSVNKILKEYTNGSAIFTPYGSAINSKKVSFFNYITIEVDFSNNSFPWLGYNIEDMSPIDLLSSFEIDQLPNWYYNSPYSSTCKKIVIVFEEHESSPKVEMSNEHGSRIYRYNDSFSFTDVIRIAGISEFRGQLEKENNRADNKQPIIY